MYNNEALIAPLYYTSNWVVIWMVTSWDKLKLLKNLFMLFWVLLEQGKRGSKNQETLSENRK